MNVYPTPPVAVAVKPVNAASPDGSVVAAAFVSTPPPLMVSATVIPDCDTGFPPPSSNCTLTAGETVVPTATLAGGCCAKASCEGAPAVTANGVLTTATDEGAVAVRVKPTPGVAVTVIPVKVARPDGSVAAEAFVSTPPPLIVNATAIPDCDTGFPPPSSNCTLTAGETVVPTATLAGGCCAKASCEGAPAVTANGLLTITRSGEAIAVSV